MLSVDLNVAPTHENRVLEFEDFPVSTNTRISDRQMDSPPTNYGLSVSPIDVEAIDDDVVISSRRSFTEAREQAGRNRAVMIILDEDGYQSGLSVEDPITELTLSSYKRRDGFPDGTVINCDLYTSSNRSKRHNREESCEEKKVMVPEQPAFSCPVCMGPLVSETSTVCGHIFCKPCIETAISSQKKCPTCRRKLTMKSIHRIYLSAN